MEDLDRKNFKDRTFDELPSKVACSNFKNCTFNASTIFDRCNLTACTYNAECKFLHSNKIDEVPEYRHPKQQTEIK